jgi:hypothetical protein
MHEDMPMMTSPHYRARYYDPSIGRFVSEDPIGYAGGRNQYAYAASNPALYLDPSGLAYTTQTSVIAPLITVNAGITLYGPGASDALAASWAQYITSTWNQNPGYGNCEVNFNVQVIADPNAQHWWQAASPGMPGANNYIYVPQGVGDASINPGGFTGTIPAGTLQFSVAHEFGHLLGLFDARPGFLLPWRDSNDIMAEGTQVTPWDINGIIHSSDGSKCGCK